VPRMLPSGQGQCKASVVARLVLYLGIEGSASKCGLGLGRMSKPREGNGKDVLQCWEQRVSRTK
jgi:hypothetical protein